MRNFFVAIFLLSAVIATSACAEKSDVQKLKQSMAEELNSWLGENDASKSRSISELGRVTWDWLCVAGYYGDGRKAARELEFDFSVDLSKFAVVDEYFLDAEEGLVFVDTKRRLLVTIPLRQNISFPHGKKACISANDLIISGVDGRTEKGTVTIRHEAPH